MGEVPHTFRDMPRWWRDEDGRRWLDRVPELVAERCRLWGLELDGAPWHGSNALVLPVRRARVPLALRMCPPVDDVEAVAAALQLWSRSPVVQLVDVEPAAGAMLLERL